MGCGEDKPAPTPTPTAEEVAKTELTGTGSQTWIVENSGSVTQNGKEISDQYLNFELILVSKPSQTYASKNSNKLFDTSGNWSFAGANFDKIMLTGSNLVAGREISFTQTSNQLRLTFSIPTPTSGRINASQALIGDYVFTLIKKQ